MGKKKVQDEDIDSDSEDEEEEVKKDNDFPSMFRGLFNAIPWKLAIIQFIIFFLVMTNMFSERILSKMKNSWVDGSTPTTSGTIAIGIMLSISLILFDLLIKSGLI